jgi:hypothetical protein
VLIVVPARTLYVYVVGVVANSRRCGVEGTVVMGVACSPVTIPTVVVDIPCCIC